jgi:hypothetical protein
MRTNSSQYFLNKLTANKLFLLFNYCIVLGTKVNNKVDYEN